MATMSTHGGSCCGMRHFSGFRDGQETNVRELVRLTSNTEYGDGRYQLEVILSDRQTRENPDLVNELARLGYVYTSSWTGQHGTPVHLFLRAKSRLALSSSNFYNRWVNDLNGMLPHPALSGTLPALAEQVAAAPAQGRLTWRNGSRVRCTIEGSPNYRRYGVIERMDYQDDRWAGGRVRYEETGRLVSYGCLGNSFELVPAAPVEQPVEPVPVVQPVYRHPNAEQVTFRGPEVVPAGFPRRLLLSQFYCVFRESGFSSRVFATMAEGQEAYPRATNWQERKVYSDGEIVEGPVNHG